MRKQFTYLTAALMTLLLAFVACESRVSGVTLNKTTLALNVGGTEALTARVLPEKAVVNAVAWSSSDTDVATVSGDGVVSAMSKGSATITVTVTSKDIEQTAKCSVTVLIPISSITLSKTELSLTAGDNESLKAKIEPENADNKALTWTSSNKDIATVDADGTITALRIGTATITASARDGSNKTATCELAVGLPRPKPRDVYVAGVSNGDATLWINGDPKSLGKGEAHSVFVTGDDIYVAGKGDGYATLWKNGIAKRLSEKSYGAEAYSVFVSGEDVFVAGKDGINAVLWKNGALQRLNSENYDSEARSVFVSGKDVYVAGWEDNGQADNDLEILKARLGLPSSGGRSGKRKSVATVWKNGKAQRLTNGSRPANAHSIFVSYNDVYVAGTENLQMGIPCSTIWENGVPERLGYSISDLSVAKSVFVSNYNVYVAGDEIYKASLSSIATLWKDGTRQRLSTTNITNNFASASSVFVANGDVLVAGNEQRGKGEDVAVIWKNGKEEYLGIGKANAVFVKQ